MGKRLDIKTTFQNADELDRLMNSLIAAVKDTLDQANLSEPGVTVQVDVVDEDTTQ